MLPHQKLTRGTVRANIEHQLSPSTWQENPVPRVHAQIILHETDSTSWCKISLPTKLVFIDSSLLVKLTPPPLPTPSFLFQQTIAVWSPKLDLCFAGFKLFIVAVLWVLSAKN
ncbi:hypothetical protein SLA2020_470190 [Shorea laevis]